MSTCNAGVYGDLGRYPLYITRYIRIIKYWCKLLNTDNIIMKTIYRQSISDCSKGYNNWVSNVKQLLETYGFADCFINGDNLDCKAFPHIFK